MIDYSKQGEHRKVRILPVVYFYPDENFLILVIKQNCYVINLKIIPLVR